MNFSVKKSCVLITGASRGIGRAIAQEFAKSVAAESFFILIARSFKDLEEVKQALMKIANISVSTLVLDLSKPEDFNFEAIVNNILTSENQTKDSFEQVIIVHNAGSIGNISKRAAEMDSNDEIQAYFKLNLLSVILLNSAFLKVFSKFDSYNIIVINVSSLCGVQPFKSFSMYCSGKASRDMFFKVLALEEPNINVLNYAPGPVETDMVANIVENTWDESLANANTTMRENGTILAPETTAKRLVKILDDRKYSSGDHVDYFDDI
ncbi:sepiapterin reductase-like [Artemia franciscana]|uniref:sepiapterin reductase-like n=1 Tax=Artemia franciscana TaxID=6661 RepID=UPI0032D9B551